MANPFNLGLFKGPRYSAFPISHDNKISMSAGKITPIYWDFLNTGDKIEADVADVVRLAPMVVPTLDTYRVDIHAFALRLRSLGNANRNPWVYEDFFNLNKNTDGSRSLPSLPLGWLFSLNGFRTGTLLESLGIPTFKKDREAYLDFIRNYVPWVLDPVVASLPSVDIVDDGQATGIFAVPASMPVNLEYADGLQVKTLNGYQEIDEDLFLAYKYTLGAVPYYLSKSYHGNVIRTPFNTTLIGYIAERYPSAIPVKFYQSDKLGINFGSVTSFDVGDPTSEVVTAGVFKNYEKVAGLNLLDQVYRVYKVDSISVMKDFIDYLLDGLLSLTSNGVIDDSTGFYAVYGYDAINSVFSAFLSKLKSAYSDLPESDFYLIGANKVDLDIPAYPFEAYYKIISDWYINTAIDDPDTFFARHSFLDDIGLYKSNQMTGAALRAAAIELNRLFNRFWANDYFTSAFPSPQAGQAVGIPVNGTIVDLRNANAMQKLKERLLYAGSRFRDVLFAITGKKTSAAILEMSEVLGSWSNIINVDAVLQQSASTNYSPQAGYAGTGLGYRAGGKDFKYTAEEPTIIMVFASIVPKASYFQGLSRKFTRGNVYDYAIPQLANVGEQDVKCREIYVALDNAGLNSSSDQVFGYTRRNGDWMWTPNEVHGDFQGSLDFWHNSRIFGSMPALSQNFLQVNPEDDNLNRVFAVDSDSYDHFYCNFSFTGHIIRSLPKHVHYDL